MRWRIKRLCSDLRGEQGYTLLEMLMVVTIIAILASFAVTRMVRAVNQAKDNTARGELMQIAAALEQYYMAKNQYPAKLQDVLDEGIMKANTSFANKFGKRYLYAVDAADRPMAFLLADPGRKPRSSALISRQDAPDTEAIIPEGRDPNRGAYQWRGDSASHPRLFLQDGGAYADIPSVSVWVRGGRTDLVTE